MHSSAENEGSSAWVKRSLLGRYEGIPATDGNGVKLTRIIGSLNITMLDPFLLLDCFESENRNDYIGGFPTHPHRGFETVTYMLNGHMRHKDSRGHEGLISPGGVQWMTAARGIEHSEMPERDNGLFKGFQLWVNLPASLKMQEPEYQEYATELIPKEYLTDGTAIRVIAGKTNSGITGPVMDRSTAPLYLDVSVLENGSFNQFVPQGHNAFVFVIQGSISLLSKLPEAGTTDSSVLKANQLGVLSKGEQISISGGEAGGRFLLIAGQPLNEPVMRSGPFVMNTKQQLLQAYADYRSGNF
mgnify:CR=1 FL=1